MNLGLWPEAVPFDPDDGAGSRELDAFLEGVSFPRAALVVAGCGTEASEWPARAAIGLARALEASGHNVLLADLGFEAPSLHGLLSESTVEGLADALLFGSSLERVTVLPAGQTFEFVPAGAFAPDPAALRSDPAWGRMLAEMASRNTLFLGYTPFDSPGLDRLVERIPSVVILAETEEASRTVARLPEEIRIEALIRPARPLAGTPVEEAEPAGADPGTAVVPDAVLSGAAPEETAGGAGTRTASGMPVEAEAAGIATGELAEPGSMPAGVAVPEAGARTADADFDRIRLPKDEAREALIADLRARQRATLARAGAAPDAGAAGSWAAADAGVTPGAHGDLTEPSYDLKREIGSDGATRQPRHWRRWLIGALLVAAGTVLAWYFGFRGEAGGGGDPVAPIDATRAEAPPVPAGAPVVWSVAVEAHDRMATAVRSVDSLGTADSTMTFYISPAVVSGDLWYRVLAGPFEDSIAAGAAMERLVAEGLKRGGGVWDVRQTPLTFELGRFPLEADATSRMNELGSMGIPAYVVEVPYSRGGPWYHLYGGAYSSAPEAARMRVLLRDAGLPDSLVTRTGRAAS
jgi:hypothetical protein